MDARQQRGLKIAAICRIQRKGGVYLVPSESGKGKRYTVCPDPTNPRCTCPDHETRGLKCKHIFAVEFVIQRQKNHDGSETVTKSVKITERKTYPQNWRAYNAAQTHEKAKFQSLLHDLCQGIEEPPHVNGRRPLSFADSIFCIAYKVYSTFSGRRFTTDLKEAHKNGYSLLHLTAIQAVLNTICLVILIAFWTLSMRVWFEFLLIGFRIAERLDNLQHLENLKHLGEQKPNIGQNN